MIIKDPLPACFNDAKIVSFFVVIFNHDGYLEFISSFEETMRGIKKLKDLSRTMESNGRKHKGFNFFNEDELHLLERLIRGEFNIKGFQNKDLRQYFHNKSSGYISNILKRLKLHGLIKGIKNTYKYYLTKLGKEIIIAGLKIKRMFLIPELARC